MPHLLLRQRGPKSANYTGPGGPVWYARTSDSFIPLTEASPKTCAFKVFIPAGYSSRTPHRIVYQWPDSGARGTDNTSQLGGGLAKALSVNNLAGTYTQATWPTILVAIQYPQFQPSDGVTSIGAAGRYWGFPLFAAVMSAVEREWNVDATRRFCTGWSLGGNTCLEYLGAYRYEFRAAFVTECNLSSVVHLLTPVSPQTTQGSTDKVASVAATMPIKHYQAIDDSSLPYTQARVVRDAFWLTDPTHATYEYIEIASGVTPTQTHIVACDTFYADAGNTLYPWLMAF